MKNFVGIVVISVILWGIICVTASPKPPQVNTRKRDIAAEQLFEVEMHCLTEADQAVARGDYKAAERLLLPLIQRDRVNPVVWPVLGDLYSKQGRTQEAVAAFAKVVHPGPKSGSTLQKDSAFLMRYAVLCGKTNQWHEARLAANEAISYSESAATLTAIPNWVRPQLTHLQALSLLFDGIQATKNGDEAANRKAVDLFNAALDLSPNLAAASYQKGLALENLGRPSEAENAYREAVRHGNDAVKGLLRAKTPQSQP